MVNLIQVHKMPNPSEERAGLRVYQLKSSNCRLQAVTNTSMKLNEPVAVKATYASTVDILVISPEISLSSLIMPSRWETSVLQQGGNPGRPIYKYASPSLPISIFHTPWFTVEIRLGKRQLFAGKLQWIQAPKKQH